MMKKINPIKKLNPAQCLLLAGAVFLSTSTSAQVPDFSMRLSSGCEISSSDTRAENAVVEYLTGRWVIEKLQAARTPEELMRVAYDYSVYQKEIPEEVTFEAYTDLIAEENSGDAAEGEIRDFIFTQIIDSFSEIVEKFPEPEEGGFLTIVQNCEVTQPTSAPGFTNQRTYELTHKRRYNAPLELANLRLTLGMNTYVVVEYYNNQDTKLRVFNEGITALEDFKAVVGDRTLFTRTIRPNQIEEATLSRQASQGTFSSSERLGLKTYSSELMGRNKIIQ